jgi:hypothetical protein
MLATGGFHVHVSLGYLPSGSSFQGQSSKPGAGIGSHQIGADRDQAAKKANKADVADGRLDAEGEAESIRGW